MNSKHSIAILPFVNISSDKDNDYFSDGITEEIINSLSKIQGLQVSSRTSSFAYKGSMLSVKEISDQLGVKMVLEGSVRKVGENIRISVHLISAKDGFQYWSETFLENLTDIFQVQDDISLQVANKIREYLGHFNVEDFKPTNIDNIDTYDLFLRSRFNFNKFQKEDILLAAHQIEEVIKRSKPTSKYYAAKGIYFGYLGVLNVLSLKEAFNKSKTAAIKAIEIDPKDAEAHHAMAVTAYLFEGDINKAQYHNTLSLKYRPNYVEALYANSIIALVSRNYDMVYDGINKALGIDPHSVSLKYFKAVILMHSNELDKALEIIEETLNLNQYNSNVYHLKGVILGRLGRYEEAIIHFQNVPVELDKTVVNNAALSIVYGLKGEFQKAIEQLNLSKKEDYNLNIAYEETPEVMINILSGNYDEAFIHLEKDIKAKKNYLKFYHLNPIIDRLKLDRRYKIFDKVLISKGKIHIQDKEKYVKSGLKADQLISINKSLLNLMEEKKPHLHSDVSLKIISESISESVNHVSQVINDKHKRNFFDFINRYRIEEMKELLSVSSNKKFTLLSLAFEAGFNSKTTFNVAFKKLKGTTPTKYFKKLELI